MAEMTRREFVRTGAVAAAAVVVGASSGCGSPGQPAAQVETPTRHYGGGGTMSKRVLVGYATRTGSTVGVAEKIGEILAQRGFEVDVRPLREQPPLADYDAVVLGSAINGGQWLPEALGFVESNRALLAGVPVCVFCVHSMNGGQDERQSARRLAYLDKVRSVVKPADEAFFLGKGPDPEDTSFIARWAFKAFGGAGEGDMRDWDKIGAWAKSAAV